MKHRANLAKRFRGLLPIVVDVETAGLNPEVNPLLEVSAVTLKMDADGTFSPKDTHTYHVEPFVGSVIENDALEITGIDPTHPFRFAVPEAQALNRLFDSIRSEIEQSGTYRAVLVGHNAWFDLSFILAAAKRAGIKHVPFHRFTTFDTATLAGVHLGETVLARATRRARIPFDVQQAHSAEYDAERTAELFCLLVNGV